VRRSALGLGLALIALAPSGAWAGAWTLPQGNGQIIESFFGWTGTGAPWGNGAPGQTISRIEAQTYIEYGLSNEITLFGQIAAERYALSPPQENVYTGLDYSDLGARAKVWSNDAWVFSLEASAFVPGAHDPSQPAQAGNTGWAGEARALAGRNLTILNVPAFIDAEASYRLRTAGPPNEWHADFTLGLKPNNSRIMWLFQAFNTISATSTNSQFPAWRSSTVEASVVYALDQNWYIQAGAFTTIWTENTNTEHGIVLAIWRKF
jgi:hypothetical protein